MSGQDSEQNISPIAKIPVTTITAASNTTYHTRHNLRNFLLIWVDASIDESSKVCQNTLAELQSVANDVITFTQIDECVDFFTDIENKKVFLIIESNLGQQIAPLIHDIPQLDAVYIFCSNKSSHEQWTKRWNKIKGIYTEITSIRGTVQMAVKQYNQDSIAVSFVTVSEATSSQNLDKLEPSFMYTQIFKEILLKMEYNNQSIKEFVVYCQNGDYGSPNNITLFKNEYHANFAIWWYTYPSFIYSMLNHALRMLQADTIINMGFFIYDLHRQIERLHRHQVSGYKGKSFTVYRGQGLSITDFNKLRKTEGGLMSFNNFLSTSKKREVSHDFATIASTKKDTVGILFQISINPSVSSIPFAAIQDINYFQDEDEILFSMHTVFRIDKITQIDINNPFYQVELHLTSDDDQQLRILTEHLREEAAGDTGWERIGNLLVKIGQFDKAEELYETLLEKASNDSDKAVYYNQLGYVKIDQGDYEKAICYYEKHIETQQKFLRTNHPLFSTSYINMGGAYGNIGEYSKALLFHEKALKIVQNTLPSNHPNLAISYNNIGEMYRSMGEYPKAFLFYEKALEIRQKILPPNHPDLANSYNNIGSVCDHMGEYSKALLFYKKSLEIKQRTLLSNHPLLATSYNNIGEVYRNIGDYPKAFSFHENALEIRQKLLPSNHPLLATSYNNIGEMYRKSGEYVKALSFYDKALEIQQKAFPSNHPLLATSYNNIGSVCDKMGEYSKALLLCEKAIDILQIALPPNHSLVATFCNNIASVHGSMTEYSMALSFYEKALNIFQKTLPVNHPDLAAIYNNIGSMYDNMEDYLKALSFHEKALEIIGKTLPSNHPLLATSYKNIGLVYYKVREHSKALSYFELALDIWQCVLPAGHPDIKTVRKNIEFVKKKL